MTLTVYRKVDSLWRGGRLAAVLPVLLLTLCCAVPAGAWVDTVNPTLEMGYAPNGVFEVNGDFVMNVGEAQVNITNWGLIGSAYSSPSTYSDAPSCQWPAGSGNEYLWAAGLWVGGVVLGDRLVSQGIPSGEFMPLEDRLESTIYEGIGAKLTRPTGNDIASGRRRPQPSPDDDGDGVEDEETLNGYDDDGDGLIDEDFGQIGNQMLVLTNYDNTRLAQESFPDHTPMNLEVVQSSYQWENDAVDDFVAFDFKITNIGVIDLDNVYIGFYADSDIGPRGLAGAASDDRAGSFDGMVQAADGSWVPVAVGYMFDWADGARLDGYFGIAFLGHDVDPTGRLAPDRIGLRTFQSFHGNASFDQGGDPTNDDEAYQLLSAEESDDDTPAGKEDDFRFLVSAGPFMTLPAGGVLNFQVAMVVGPGKDGMLRNCAEAALTWYGIYIDEINSVTTNNGAVFNPGRLGRETMLCREDFDSGTGGDNPWDQFKIDYMDTSCVDPEWVLNQPKAAGNDSLVFDYEVDGVTKTCAMFNMDNCFECARQLGHRCTASGAEIENRLWNCNRGGLDDAEYAGCTGVGGLETQIHWLVGMAPPPPGMRLWATNNRVHVFWDDRSEKTPDIRLGEIDFESYRVWRADNWDRPYGSSLENGPSSQLWQLIAEYDVVNNYVTRREIDGVTYLDTIPLGRNTGLDMARYEPVCLTNPAYDGLADSMQVVVNADVENEIRELPPLRDTDGRFKEEFMPIRQWESYPDVLDTFFAVAARDSADGVKEKVPTWYYEYIDHDVHNGFIYFYSVTATDHDLLPKNNEWNINLPVGEGLSGDPGSSFNNTVPGTKAQTAEERERFGTNIYVYPNPATREALAEYQQLYPNGDDPTGVRVTFTNLPAAHNTIKIFTVAGDLVQTISHDGTDGSGHVSWNLMSRNLQEIVSGIYLYSVQSDDGRFDDFIGKFVVVR